MIKVRRPESPFLLWRWTEGPEFLFLSASSVKSKKLVNQCFMLHCLTWDFRGQSPEKLHTHLSADQKSPLNFWCRKGGGEFPLNSIIRWGLTTCFRNVWATLRSYVLGGFLWDFLAGLLVRDTRKNQVFVSMYDWEHLGEAFFCFSLTRGCVCGRQ